MSKKKIVWINHSAGKIYPEFFHSLGKHHPEFDLTIVKKGKRKERIEKEYYSIQSLEFKFCKFLKLIFLHRMITNFFKGKSNQDLPGIMKLKGLKKYLKQEKPDVVMVNSFYRPFVWEAAKFCRQTGTTFILFTQKRNFHNNKISEKILTKIVLFALRRVFRQAEYIIPFSQDAYEFGKEHFPVKDKKKIRMIPPGVDSSLFYNSNIKEKNNEGRIDLLMVGRFIPCKRHNDLLKALDLLKEKSDLNIKLSLLGEGALKEKVKQKVNELGLEEDVRFLEKVPYEKIRDVYSSHDLLILPSCPEAIGMVVLEAMACGLPVIVSKGAGAHMYVHQDYNGHTFKPGDYEDLAAKIELLTENRQKLKEYGKNSEELARTEYDIDILSEKLYKLIQEIQNDRK